MNQNSTAKIIPFPFGRAANGTRKNVRNDALCVKTANETAQAVEEKDTSAASVKPDVTVTDVRPHESVQPIKDVNDIQAAKEYFLNQTPRFQANATNLRNYMMFVLSINNGTRISDMLSLRIGDVLYEDGAIKDEVFIREMKTGKTRYVFLGEGCKQAVEMYLAALPHYDADDYLFSSRKKDKNGMSKPISRTQAWKIISSMGEAISADRQEKLHLGTHSMRKTFGYQKIKQNPNDQMIVAQISEMYNHSNMNTTYRYLGMDVESKRALAMTNEL